MMNTLTDIAMQISILDTKPVFDPYQNTGAPSRTEVWFDPRNKDVQVRQEFRTNSTLMGIYDGHILTHQMDGHPREDDVRQVLEDNADLLGRVAAGYQSIWDGHNMVGRYTRDAERAWQELCEILDTCEPYYEFWDTSEWISDAMHQFITADSTDEELRRYAEEWTQVDPTTVLDADAEWVLDYLIHHRDELRDG